MFLKEVLLKILLYTQEIFSPAAPARVPRIPEFWPPHFQGLSIACSSFLFLKAVALLYQPVSMKGGRHCVSHFCPVQGAYWCRRSQKVHQCVIDFEGELTESVVPWESCPTCWVRLKLDPLLFISWFVCCLAFFFLSESFNDSNVTPRAEFSKPGFPKAHEGCLDEIMSICRYEQTTTSPKASFQVRCSCAHSKNCLFLPFTFRNSAVVYITINAA